MHPPVDKSAQRIGPEGMYPRSGNIFARGIREAFLVEIRYSVTFVAPQLSRFAHSCSNRANNPLPNFRASATSDLEVMEI